MKSKIKYKENDLISHISLGKVRMYEYNDKMSLVKMLNKDLKTWTIKRVHTETLYRDK